MAKTKTLPERVERVWYKKFKVMVLLCAVVLSILIGTVGTALTPYTVELIISVVALALSVIVGHSLTDSKAQLAGLLVIGTKEKPFYKKTKFMTAAGATILNVAMGIFGEKLSPNVTEMIYAVTALAISVIGGHTYTDAKNLLSVHTSKK